ncbi:STAS domain-containing protein [Streptomyces flaveolus]|uniref:STAS domain-containing protein n=1 Tax=Streptomyces flaveolus TaxID=67297 RepID=UPI0036F95177
MSVRIGGEMDHLTAPFFRACIGEEIVRGQQRVVLDLSGVSFCVSSGLNVLL